MGVADLVSVPSDPFVPSIYRVSEVRRELADTVTLTLVPTVGTRPSFEPGQFNMLYVLGVGEVAISISDGHSDSNAFVHTVRDVGAVSGALTRLKAGAELGLRGPFGTGWPVAAAQGADVVVVAGGLGLAPLRPLIHLIMADRHRYGRVAILVGSRDPSMMLYRGELAQWRQRLDVDINVTVDHADSDWRGSVGVVPNLIPRVTFDPADTVAMVCGPEVMMRFTVTALAEARMPLDRIYVSMERNMKCAIGLCGHCQFGRDFICKDGPVMAYHRVADILSIREM